MAKSELKIKAREMRRRGESVREIARRLNVAKSTVSLWGRDLILSVEQLQRLKNNSLKGRELGRLKGAFVQKRRRLEILEKNRKEGIGRLRDLSDREFL